MSSRTGLFIIAALVSVASLLASRGGPAGEPAGFVRGDANNDGRVSIADVHAITNYLFRGRSPSECPAAMDVDDNGRFDGLQDAAVLASVLERGGSLPSPFPEPGPDPTANENPLLDRCEAYGVAEPLQDPGGVLRVLDAVAAGGDDPTAVLTVAVSNTRGIAGFSGTISLEGIAIAEVNETRSLLDAMGGHDGAHVRGHGLYFGYVHAWVSPDHIRPGEESSVLEIETCLLWGTRAGQYPLPLASGELVDFETGLAVEVELAGGTLTVLEDLREGAVGAGCEWLPPNCTPPGWHPPQIEATLSLSGAAGVPGGTVELPLTVLANGHVQGYSFSIDFDETVLQCNEIEPLYAKPDGTEYGFKRFEINNENQTPGSGGVDEGFAVGAVLFSIMDNCNDILPLTPTELLRLHFVIDPEAQVESTEVSFLDGGESSAQPVGVQNTVSVNSITADLETAGSFVLVDGRIEVVPDGTLFIRADTDGNGEVELTDAVATLSYLFRGDRNVRCLDAADADDNGTVNIADPIRTLQVLFRGGASLPAPRGACGEDPTADLLAPCVSQACLAAR